MGPGALAEAGAAVGATGSSFSKLALGTAPVAESFLSGDIGGISRVCSNIDRDLGSGGVGGVSSVVYRSCRGGDFGDLGI